MTKKEIIGELAKKKAVEEIIINIEKQWHSAYNDLAQDIYIDLLNKDEEKIVKLYETDQLRFFLTRIVYNQLHSVTSDFYRTYRKYEINNKEFKLNEL